MILISILIGLALEYFLGVLDRFRDFSWFDHYHSWLESKCNQNRYWDSPAGLLLTLAVPLVLLIIAAHILNDMTILFGFILATAVFVYSLGPELNNIIDGYLDALEDNDEEDMADIEQTLLRGEEEVNDEAIIRAILLKAHETLFGTIFWFIVLGMYGALIFCLVSRMREQYADVHGGYAAAVEHLHKILIWPSSRLMVLGFALSGSLVDALDGWRNAEGESLEASQDVVGEGGLGALQYRPDMQGEYEQQHAERIEWVKQTQALINRTLIVWLTVLGVMTIGGWLG